MPKRKAWPMQFYTYSSGAKDDRPEVRHHVAESPMEYLRILREEQSRPGVRMVVAEERYTGMNPS